jgi:hypothetical protein
LALTRTAQQLVADVRNRADHLVGTFRTDAQLMHYISESCRSLVSWLVDDYESMYWATRDTIFTTTNQLADDLPPYMWKLITMRCNLNGERIRIEQADLDELDAEYQDTRGWTTGFLPRYVLMGKKLYWTPIPQAAHSINIYYVSINLFESSIHDAKPELDTGTDTFDGIFGWDSWVVLDAAIKLLSDEKKDTTVLAAERELRKQEIAAAARSQQSDEAPKVRDRYNPDGLSNRGRMPPGGWF